MNHIKFLTDLKEQIPTVHIIDQEVVTLGKLSPGCQACQNGTWDCTFVTMGCNLKCSFCCSPLNIPMDYHGSAFGTEPEEILKNQAKTEISGISFSGGEVFTQRERLFAWIETFRQARPDAYLWLYTNGVLITDNDLARLAQLGIDEIRFNLAATNYTHPRILQTMKEAAMQLTAVTVEIPTIPQHREKLLAALPLWDACGVKYLNLHELMHEPGTLSENLAGHRHVYKLADGHVTHINADSRNLICEVMLYVQKMSFTFSVNACLLQTKIRQVRGRRRNLAPLTQQPFERFDGTFFETIRVTEGDQYVFVHPDDVVWEEINMQRLQRAAPLSLFEETTWA
ncbi:MAG: radical SAM protein [Ardenticatenaceae bacterium]|nr:radical SAM protein [Ardenticatenaceae bacterium]